MFGAKNLTMKIRSSSLRAAALSILATGLSASARGEDGPPAGAPTGLFEVCRFGPEGGGCAHFEGYVYVRPGAEQPYVSAYGKPASATRLGGDRLYIHVDSDPTR
jgi:hypothetical protein